MEDSEVEINIRVAHLWILRSIFKNHFILEKQKSSTILNVDINSPLIKKIIKPTFFFFTLVMRIKPIYFREKSSFA